MNRDKKLGRRKAGTYGRTAKHAQKRIANKATRKVEFDYSEAHLCNRCGRTLDPETELFCKH